MDFDPILLRAFVAVKEAGGFTRAAQRLHLTQSAVSHQIRRLEEQVGRPLLARTTRKLVLTEDGEDFLRHAQQILRALDELGQRFRPSPVAGVLRFGVPENFMGEQLAPLLCRFARAFPAVRLDVSVSNGLDLRAMISAGELDLAVVMAPPRSMEGTVLRRTRFVWAASEGFEPAAGSLPLAFIPAPCMNRQVGVEALEGEALGWHVVFTSPSQQGLGAAVRAGLAITVLALEDVEPGMRVIDGQYGLPQLPEVDFRLIWSAGEPTPAAREFGRLIQDLPAPAVPARVDPARRAGLKPGAGPRRSARRS